MVWSNDDADKIFKRGGGCFLTDSQCVPAELLEEFMEFFKLLDGDMNPGQKGSDGIPTGGNPNGIGGKPAKVAYVVYKVLEALTGGQAAKAIVRAAKAVRKTWKQVRSKAKQALRKLRRKLFPCKKNSFAAQTLVLMCDGTTKPIADVRRGELVWGRSDRTGEDRCAPVTQVIRGVASDVVQLTLADDEGVQEVHFTTAAHPYRVVGRGWMPAGQLHHGDVLVTRTATSYRVVGAQAQAHSQPVYNLSVDQLHSFFIGKRGVWVHNCDKVEFDELGDKGRDAFQGINSGGVGERDSPFRNTGSDGQPLVPTDADPTKGRSHKPQYQYYDVERNGVKTDERIIFDEANDKWFYMDNFHNGTAEDVKEVIDVREHLRRLPRAIDSSPQ